MINGFYIPTRQTARFGVLPHCEPNDPECDNLGGGGGGGGGGNGLPQMTIPPNWSIGIFYAPNIQLTIGSTGYVTAVNTGVSYGGIYSNGKIYLNGHISTVAQIVNGIQTYNQNTGQVTNYTRDSNSGGGIGSGDNGDDDNGHVIDQNTGICTADAKVCSNGSSVGRDPNNSCQFRPCPAVNNNPISGIIDVITNNGIFTYAKENPLIAAGVVIGGIFLFTRRS
jgi:hypothetical protein